MKRDQPIPIMATKEEKKQIQENAKKDQRSVASYLIKQGTKKD